MDTQLRAARKGAGLSQVQLAERAGVPQSNISRFEQGKQPFVDDAVRLARALDTTVESLFPGGEELVDDETTCDREHEMVDPRPSVSP